MAHADVSTRSELPQTPKTVARRPTRSELISRLQAKLDELDSPLLAKLMKQVDAAQPVQKKATKAAPVSFAGAGLGRLVSVAAGKATLDALSVDEPQHGWMSGDFETSGATAQRLGVSSATLANWRQAGRVIALKKGPRNYVYPVHQFNRLGPPAGLPDVLSRFAAADIAWDWLLAPNVLTGDAAPIDRLKAGHKDEVVRAAEGALDYQ